ncbi:MAG TPA: hypothetical protein VFS67_05095, partial [Polyangiaceae bacterium]|nr:hypothetical protein [Polyangiaceae bacterium]
GGGAAPPASSAAPTAAAPSPDLDPGAALRAYYQALAQRRLDAAAQLSTEKLRASIESAEAQLGMGRRNEAIAILAGVVESPRFAPLRTLDEGRAAVFTLGDALGRAGAYQMARVYLLRLIQGSAVDGWYRRAVSSLVDIGLAGGEPEQILQVLPGLPASAEEPWAGDVAYLHGVLWERMGRTSEALQAYARVNARSRFWAQANYRAGLIEVDQRQFAQGEQHFCKVADPKQTPKLAPLFGGNDFFQVRDLARLALGRVAHEQYRFDDARYYYHLVPADSERLPEALYESATSRYEAKDYASAHRLINELRALDRPHAYADEVWILDAYVDLAECQFPRADAKLEEFLKRYEPVLDAARRLESDPRALQALIDGSRSTDAQGAMGLGLPREVTELLVSAIRVDPTYGRVSHQLAELDRELGGIDGASAELAELSARVRDPEAVKPRPASAIANTPADRLRELAQQTAALRRLLREASLGQGGAARDLQLAKQELIDIEAQAEKLQAALAAPSASAATARGTLPAEASLDQLLRADADEARELAQGARALRAQLVEQRDRLGQEALGRLERRLTRLVRRARAGRIETVLGRKQALELEVEALSQGYLPPGAVDSLEAARYLGDDEEYWPFDGEDWDDEYIGGEGLR